MNRATKQIHENLLQLGENLGFHAAEEVVGTSLSFIADEKHYIPRVDVVWSIELTQAQRRVLSLATQRPETDFERIPIMGIEV